MKKICFCAFNAYPILCDKNIKSIGGAELQQMLLGKELQKRGYDVSFIVLDYGQHTIVIKDGIKLIKTLKAGYAISGIMPIIYAIMHVFGAFFNADADVYYQRCGSYYTGVVSIFCLIMHKKYIYQLGSDLDVDANHINKMKIHERLLYKFGVMCANHIIVQSIYQQQMMKKVFNRESLILKNPFPTRCIEKRKSITPIVLWVGGIKPEIKQPELFLELAKMVPTAKFQIIGGPSKDMHFYKKIRSDAKKIKNLEFLGFIPFPEIQEYFNNAAIFVNTSSVEGFPNTFLQAWAAGIPVVSLNVDPDEIICKYKLGFHSKTMENLANNLMDLLNNEELRMQMGLNGLNYVESEHNMDNIIEEFIKLL